MKVLVSGANGMLAQAIKSVAPEIESLEVCYLTKSEWDITDQAANQRTIESHKPNVVINTAAYTKVDHAEGSLHDAAQINHHALTSLSKETNKVGARLVHISTDYVFDGQKIESYLEDDPCFPLNNYGLTKRLGELAVVGNCKEYVILRTSWLYTSIGNNFFRTILRLAEEKAEISIVSDQVSAPTYAIDLARAIWDIIRPKYKEAKGIYHYSNTGEASWYDFAKKIVDLSDRTCKVLAIPSSDYPQAAQRPTYSKLNTDKIAQHFQMSLPTWQSGVERCWNSYKNL